MSSPHTVQSIYLPRRPAHSDEEINKDLAPALRVLIKYGLLLFHTFAHLMLDFSNESVRSAESGACEDMMRAGI